MEKIIKILLYTVPLSILVVNYQLMFPFITAKHFAFRTLVEIMFIFYIPLVYQNRPKFSKLTLIVAGFCLIVGLCNLVGINLHRSFWSNYERMDGYINLLHLTGYFLIVVTVLKTKKDWLRLFMSFIIVNFISNMLILIQNYNVIYNPAYTAIFNFLVMIFILVHIVNTKKRLFKVFLVSVLSINIGVTYLMVSRAEFLALFVFLFSISVLYLRRRFGLAFLSIVLLITVGVGIYFKGGELSPKFKNLSFNSPTIKMRILTYKTTLKGFLDRPIFGYGQENYYAIQSKYYEPELFGIEKWIDNPHNAYLEWLIETGIVGLSAYLLIFFYSFYVLKKGSLTFAEKAIIGSGLLGYMVHNLFLFDTLVSYLPFFTLIGYIAYEKGDIQEINDEELIGI